MSRFVLLDPTCHAGLHLDPTPRGGGSATVQLGRSEVPLAIGDYPLFLAKDENNGTFGIVALVGLVAPGNLFWNGGRWAATYLPEIILSAPFRLSPGSPTGLSIDREDRRLGRSGEPLFTEAGAASPTLIRERERLERTLADVEEGRRTAAALVAASVIRPLSILLTFDTGSSHLLQGLYSPDPEALASLDDPAVVAMFRSADLAVAMLMNGSLTQLERLRQLHNGGAAGPRIVAIATQPA